MEFTHVKELVGEIQVAMLTTVEPDGLLRSRPMATVQVDDQNRLWFFTREGSPKNEEVQEDPRVNLNYSDPQGDRYVSITGTCSLVHDWDQIERLWKPVFRAWFPEGPDDPDLALLCVTPEQAEYWDAPSGRMKKITGFLAAAASGEPYEPGRNQKLRLVSNR